MWVIGTREILFHLPQVFLFSESAPTFIVFVLPPPFPVSVSGYSASRIECPGVIGTLRHQWCNFLLFECRHIKGSCLLYWWPDNSWVREERITGLWAVRQRREWRSEWLFQCDWSRVNLWTSIRRWTVRGSLKYTFRSWGYSWRFRKCYGVKMCRCELCPPHLDRKTAHPWNECRKPVCLQCSKLTCMNCCQCS